MEFGVAKEFGMQNLKNENKILRRPLTPMETSNLLCRGRLSILYNPFQTKQTETQGRNFGAFHDRSTCETPILHPTIFDFAQNLPMSLCVPFN